VRDDVVHLAGDAGALVAGGDAGPLVAFPFRADGAVGDGRQVGAAGVGVGPEHTGRDDQRQCDQRSVQPPDSAPARGQQPGQHDPGQRDDRGAGHDPAGAPHRDRVELDDHGREHPGGRVPADELRDRRRCAAAERAERVAAPQAQRSDARERDQDEPPRRPPGRREDRGQREQADHEPERRIDDRRMGAQGSAEPAVPQPPEDDARHVGELRRAGPPRRTGPGRKPAGSCHRRHGDPPLAVAPLVVVPVLIVPLVARAAGGPCRWWPVPLVVVPLCSCSRRSCLLRS
jgi:hypothetical protein